MASSKTTTKKKRSGDPQLINSEPLLSEGRGEEELEAGAVEQVLVSPGSFIILLTISAGLGGFVFGYDTGVISGALLYIRDDFESVSQNVFLQETIVSAASFGAVLGAATGGRLNDYLGRKPSMLISDAFFITGSLMMACAPHPYALIAGHLFVGSGIGVSSMTIPLYIAEAAPCDKRGALLAVNTLMATTGQFLAYVVNYAFTTVPGTWRWMVGVAAIPAILQAAMFTCALPESPRWLASQDRADEAIELLKKIHSPDVVRLEIQEMLKVAKAQQRQSVQKPRVLDLMRFKELRVAATAGIGMMVSRQLAGLSIVQYYSPSIVQQAGFASNQIALLLSSGVAAVHVFSTCFGVLMIDRVGRRKLAMSSLFGVMVALALLSAAFHQAALNPPSVHMPNGAAEWDLMCPDISRDLSLANCVTCLASACGFCGNSMQPGTCLIRNDTASELCIQSSRSWYNEGCPSDYGWLALLGFVLFIMAFSPGLGPVPWAVNAEIYPQRYRGLGGGVATTVNWVSNFVVAQSFLSLVEYWGASLTFMLCAGITATAFVFVTIAVPETKGLRLEQVKELLEDIVQAGGLLRNWYRGGWYAVSREIDRNVNGVPGENLEPETLLMP